MRVGVNATPGCVTPGKETQCYFILGCVGHKSGLDGYGKFCAHQDSIPELSSP